MQNKELKPYEKFMRFGAGALSDKELLAVILRTGTKNKDALALAEEVLNMCGEMHGLLGLHHLEASDLTKIDGIGEVKAVKLKCIAELSNRIAKRRVIYSDSFKAPDIIAAYYMESMRHLEYEKCIAMFLDSKCHLLTEQTISKGGINSTVISRRELFKHALKANAAQIILLHNHPSGDPTPSKDDIEVTKVISKAAALLEIPLADHIIIGDNIYISFREKGLL